MYVTDTAMRPGFLVRFGELVREDESLLMIDEGLAIVASMIEGRSYVVEGVSFTAAVADLAIDAQCLAIMFERFVVSSGTLA